ncbi:hypothetical protein [Kitasatospora sp. NPDC093679]|uniref:hypothetical protein n=1 Tax=Kitasatospora sp. NPDC093679 TaxID=3154983 RepID=UPI0034425E7C
MHWGQEPESERAPGDRLTELAAFVRAQLGRGPALLWTERDSADGSGPPSDEEADTLAAALAPLLGPVLGRAPQPVPTAVAGRSADPGQDTDSDVLLLQVRAAGDVALLPPAAAGRRPATRLRLRAGQSLLLPHGWGYRLDDRPELRPLVLRLSAADRPAPRSR